MKIAFDMQPLLNSNKSGVGYNEHGLVTGLMKKYTENEYLLEYFGYKDAETKKEIVAQYEQSNATANVCSWFPGSLYRLLSTFFYLPYHCFFKKNREITHFFNYFIPPGVRGKRVVTIHDMAFREFPETVRFKTKIFLKLGLRKSIKRADKVITVSEFSRSEIQKYYAVPDTRIAVVPNGVDSQRFHDQYTEKEIEHVRKKYEIKTAEYFLFLGNVEPRKNLVRMIQAYALFVKQHKGEDVPELVIAGGRGWLCDEIYEEAAKNEINNHIRFTGYVEDGDVPLLMSGAMVFCFPSLYEGFGMPPLEAMACGTPVLTSNTTSLAEVVGDAAITVNPLDVDEMADGLSRLFKSETLRESLHKKGMERAKKYSWENAVDKLYQVYEQIKDDMSR